MDVQKLMEKIKKPEKYKKEGEFEFSISYYNHDTKSSQLTWRCGTDEGAVREDFMKHNQNVTIFSIEKCS